MLRLAHKLITHNVKLVSGEDTDGLRSRCAELIVDLETGKAPIIIADNVEIYWAMTEKQPVDLNEACLMPPFPSFFIEAMVDVGDREKHPFGWWFTQRDDGFLRATTHGLSPADLDRIRKHPKTHRLIGLLVICRPKDGVPMYTDHGICLLLNSEGQREFMSVLTYGFNPCSPDEVVSIFTIPLMTLAFMNCKNVNQIDVTKEEGPPPKWCRRQRVRELKYHALKIDPNFGSRPPSGERKTEGDRSGKALHICRGHFVHYRNDGVSKGFMGKGIYGTFWVPAHVRGSLDQGKVISTYNVMAPMPQATAAV